jgi:putative FmdB family regulatory protein
MPLYEYKCCECEYVFDKIQGMNKPNPACPKCKGKTDKQISNTSFRLAGSGWEKDGYQKKD